MARSTLLRIPDSCRGPLPLRRLLAVSAIALATANCSTNPQKFAGPAGNGLDPKYGVKTSPRLYNEGDVIPKGGGRRFSGKPYVVAGRTYVPKEDARGYVREGLASWYGAAFHGRMTANGEVFDRHSIAAAHPTLPLPSYVRVTNTANGYSMVVRVNDRGPYHADRVMDVSEEVARALEFHNKGTAHVRVAYLGKASVAGSDDRKLLATLRTDGVPAGGRAPVMVADLGPSEEPERFSRTAPAPLAFKPAPEREERDEAPAPRPVRAPIVLARAAVAVPAALQPMAVRGQPFRPEPVRVAGLNPSAERAIPAQAPGAKVLGRPVPVRLAANAPAAPRMAQAASPRAPAVRAGAVPPAMPPSAKLALARLTNVPATATTPGGKGTAQTAAKGRPDLAAKPAAKFADKSPDKRGARLAGIY
ncbi:septal ring lytic transglycosylase RlpA family protein [Methylobacterium sp. WL8]|uniref:septal ring lytic transglycosylase RlpA family protein n=1 Tax=Methylobacterium sp. WL8 TaxID=2603899 RepID=UPI0011C6F204|nr:septal ring lytic transglycosylase RlpA family protein [Methylobacterium sp. WL8]TXN81797.1 septal ring lytic transglycosylase RlpA family protein [Methylobacterium sp. WL8]